MFILNNCYFPYTEYIFLYTKLIFFYTIKSKKMDNTYIIYKIII